MTEQNRIRVLIVDDHDMVRTGLSSFLLAFPDLELAGEASNSEEALTLCAETKPDVVLMDLMMPGVDGIAATRTIRERFPATRVLAVTSFIDRERVQAVLQAGAMGYLLKSTSADELATAIRAAHCGMPTLAPEATQALIEVATSSNGAHRPHDLTNREQEVLHFMTKGLTNAQIAQELTISRSTVKTYVSSILSKLGVASRTEAVTIALKQHLVT